MIVVYDPFNVLLDSVCSYFVEDFCIYIHQSYWSVIFFFCSVLVWFWYQGDGASPRTFDGLLSSGTAKLVRMEAWVFKGPSLLPWKKDLPGNEVNKDDNRAEK